MQRQPRGDVGFVIHVCDNDFVPLPQCLPNRQAHYSDEGSSIHAKCDFARIAGIEKDTHALAGPRDGRVYLLAVPIAATALHVALHQVLVDGVEHDLRHLRASGIVEEYERGFPMKSRKQRAD